MSINPNTPFSMIFDFNETRLPIEQNLKLRIYGEEKNYRGAWLDINFELPVEQNDGTIRFKQVENLRVFCTN